MFDIMQISNNIQNIFAPLANRKIDYMFHISICTSKLFVKIDNKPLITKKLKIQLIKEI